MKLGRWSQCVHHKDFWVKITDVSKSIVIWYLVLTLFRGLMDCGGWICDWQLDVWCLYKYCLVSNWKVKLKKTQPVYRCWVAGILLLYGIQYSKIKVGGTEFTAWLLFAKLQFLNATTCWHNVWVFWKFAPVAIGNAEKQSSLLYLDVQLVVP